MSDCPQPNCRWRLQIDRRGFGRATAAGVATMLLGEVFPGRIDAKDAMQPVQVTQYPRMAVAKLSQLRPQVPVRFDYPHTVLHSGSLLIQLSTRAGGGVGPEHDIVAFNGRCTHMGGKLADGYVPEHHVLACREHLTTFDLTRHGIVVAGHATESLPQIILEIEEDDIFATGLLGLIYGYQVNPSAGSSTNT